MAEARSAFGHGQAHHVAAALEQLGLSPADAEQAGSPGPVDLGAPSYEAGAQLWARLVELCAQRGLEVYLGDTGSRPWRLLTAEPGASRRVGLRGAVVVDSRIPTMLEAADTLARAMVVDATALAERRGAPELDVLLEDPARSHHRPRLLGEHLAELADSRLGVLERLAQRGLVDDEARSAASAAGALQAAVSRAFEAAPSRAPMPTASLPYRPFVGPDRRWWVAGLGIGPRGYVMTVMATPHGEGEPRVSTALLREAAALMPSKRQPVEAVVLFAGDGPHALVDAADGFLGRVGPLPAAQLQKRTGLALEGHLANGVRALRGPEGPRVPGAGGPGRAL